MRWMTFGILCCVCLPAPAADAPLVEKYLHTGELARGEQVLETALQAAPGDDHLRLSLGLLQVVRGAERLGQSFYEYGPLENNIQFLRLPVPKNPDPTPITYAAFRRVLDQFRTDLAAAEKTLSGITDDDVKLKLRLADIHMDLNGDKQPESTLSGIITKLGGPQFRIPANNPEFLVCIDRGDVAWLRAYCHLLMGMIEAQSAVDFEKAFDLTTSANFANPKVRFKRQDPDDWRELSDLWKVTVVKEPARLGRFRKHMVAVCELNHETWRYIRAERDDDFEWLPNSKQKGVLGLPVSDEMVDAWLGMIDEYKDLLTGKKVFSPALVSLFSPKSGNKRGLSLKELLDNPPDQVDWNKIEKEGVDSKYLVENVPEFDLGALFRVSQVFSNSFAVGYAAWFN